MRHLGLLLPLVLALAEPAFAAGTDIAGVTTAFDQLHGFFSGPLAKGIGVLAIIAGALSWFQTSREGGQKLRVFAYIAVGIGIMVNASAIYTAMGFTGATF